MECTMLEHSEYGVCNAVVLGALIMECVMLEHSEYGVCNAGAL